VRILKKDINVVDLFNEEVNKKEKKLARKIEKARRKEEKKEKQRKKELEQKEEEEFKDYLEKIKSEQVLEDAKTVELGSPINQLEIEKNIEDELIEPPKKNLENTISREQIFNDIKETEIKKEENKLEELLNMNEKVENKIKEENYPLLNVLLVIFSIVLIFIGGDYIIYNAITNYTDLPTMINSIIFIFMILFYLLSILIKNQKGIKITQILSLICMICFMGYHLFII
jgi:hypothetical protein